MRNRRRSWARSSSGRGQGGVREKRSRSTSRWDTRSKTWLLPGSSTERPWPGAPEGRSSSSGSALERLPHRRQDPVERRQVIVFEGGRGERNVVCGDPRNWRIEVVEDLLHEGGGDLRPEAGRQRRLVHDHAATCLRH